LKAAIFIMLCVTVSRINFSTGLAMATASFRNGLVPRSVPASGGVAP
jgi:hypothetical protein